MIRISVRYLANFAIITGRREETFLMPEGSSLKELLAKIVERYGTSFMEEIFNYGSNEIKPHVLVLVNGQPLKQIGSKLDTKLFHGDSITLALPISGG
ncbi:MAG: MoaD family protein [Candidatus Bathyarchaeia archaeon]